MKTQENQGKGAQERAVSKTFSIIEEECRQLGERYAKEREYSEKLEQALLNVTFHVTNYYTAQRFSVKADNTMSKKDPKNELTPREHECNGVLFLARLFYYGLENALNVTREDLEDITFYKKRRISLREIMGYGEVPEPKTQEHP